MNPSSNRYAGKCHACSGHVAEGEGYVESKQTYGRGRRRSRWLVWCAACYNASDLSGPEDRCCGLRAYEDECARRVNY